MAVFVGGYMAHISPVFGPYLSRFWPISHPFLAHISLAIFQVRLASNPIGQTFKLTFDCVGR